MMDQPSLQGKALVQSALKKQSKIESLRSTHDQETQGLGSTAASIQVRVTIACELGDRWLLSGCVCLRSCALTCLRLIVQADCVSHANARA